MRRKSWSTLITVVVALLCIVINPIFGRLTRGMHQTKSGPLPRPIVMDATPPAYVDIDMLMVGDILLHDNVNASALQEDGSYDYTHLFAHVRDEVAAADVAIVNQETPLGGADRGYGEVDIPLYATVADEAAAQGDGTSADGSGTSGDGSETSAATPEPVAVMPVFNSPDSVADAEAAAGFDVILKAQNHVFDQGYDGLAHELALWSERYPEIAVIGVSDPYGTSAAPDYVEDVYVYEKDGFRVAILNYAQGVNQSGGSDDWSVLSFLSEDKVYADVEKARSKGADMIVACPHWGTEYQTWSDSSEQYYAQVMADAGVDVIFGTHPHVIQGVEVLAGTAGNTCVCFYSNGNFVTANSMPDCMICGLSEVTLRKNADGSCGIAAARFVPAVVHGGSGPDMTTYLLRDWTDELAETSWQTVLTKGYVNERCTEILGEGFDAEQGVYEVSLPE